MPASVPPPYVLHHVPRTEEADALLAAVVDRAVAGDLAAWQDLCLVVASLGWAVSASRWATARLRRSMDDRLQITVRVLDTLHEDGFRVLRQMREKGQPVRPWLVTVCAHAAVDHIRENAARLGREADGGAGGPARFVALPAAGEVAAATEDPAWGIDARAAADLFGDLEAPQREALRHWLEGASHAETAAAMSVAGARDAERLVTAALKRLRRRLDGPGRKGGEQGT